MEALFENRFTTDVKTLVEFARKYRTGPRPVTLFTGWSVYAAVVILALVFDDWDRMLVFIVNVGLLLVLGALLPYVTAWRMCHASKKNNEGIMPGTVVQFSDNIQIFEGMVHLTIEYRKVIKVARLKHSYCLFTSKRTAVMIHEDAFTKGTFEEFKQFLREKYPHLPIPE